MKKTLLSLLGALGLASSAVGQCSVNSAPNNNCAYYSMQIIAFSLNNIPSNNPSCSPGGFGNFTTPVRQLLMGNSYNWTAQTGGGYYSLGFALWIDLNGDLVYQASEMLATSAPNSMHSGIISIPLTATPGTGRKMRIRSGWYSNINGNQACTSFLGGYGETEDYLVDIIAPPPCSGAPAANSVVGPQIGVCPGATAQLSLATTYTTFGIQYQWQVSNVSGVGPFTVIPSATTTAFTTPPVNGQLFYSAIITCTNGNASVTAVSATIAPQGQVISQVPYFEGFEALSANNQLPNCSWSMSNNGSTTRTYTTTLNQQRTARTGSKFASFFYSPSGTNYFYTNGIQLYAGVTYSTGLYFKTNYYGDLNWSNMAIMYGTSQNGPGMTVVASTNGPAASSGYKLLDGTFQVPTSGIYYLGIRGISSGGCCAYHLNWDDLFITAPCSVNTPSINLTANSLTICAGQTVNIAATGAHTYSWAHGDSGDLIFVNPMVSTSYMVTGTNTLTGCSSTAVQNIVVNQVPNIFVYSSKPSVCLGQSVNLAASGAATYTWSNGSNATNVNVSPTANTSYSVVGMGSNGCSAMATIFINVNPLPAVVASSDRAVICRGESATLTGGGATTYQWMANSLFIASPVAIVSPNTSTTYTLVGTDANGCSNATTLIQTVEECVGINGITTTNSGIKIYPNPTAGAFTIELRNSHDKAVEVNDLTGRVVYSTATKSQFVNVDLSGLASGVYYVKIQSDKTNEVIKVVKQ